MKKRMLPYLMAASLFFGLSGCASADAPLTVTATFYPLYIAALNIARDVEGVDVRCMAPPQAGCLHDYQMTTADRRSLEDSAVVIMNGAGLEGFLDKLLPSLGAAVIDASESVPLLPGREDGEAVNPHIWVSVGGMIAQVKNIAAGLAGADPAHAGQYARNCAEYVERLESLNEEMANALAPCAGAAIVTFHEAFDYFAEAFGLRVVAVIQTDEGGPSSRELAEVTAAIKRENVRALFAEPQYESISADILSRETGVPTYSLDPAVTGPRSTENYDAYIDIMRRNMDTLAEALSCGT